MVENPNPFAVCTIIAPNYLARALVLHDSLKMHHPEADFWLLLIDDAPLGSQAQKAVSRRGIHILRVRDIGLPPVEVDNFRFAYDVTEVSTAYKPWTMETVARRTGCHVVYLDPDIQFFAPMTPLVEALATHDLVLTPHVLQPMKRDGCEPTELTIKASGIYNLGFLGLNHAAGPVVRWWQERLRRECCRDYTAQLFTDQRWMDFAPSLFRCHIAKEDAFNVAYWNADQRPITREGGQYLAGGKPLSFFHYSGLDEKAPHLLTRHQAGRPRVLLSENAALAQLTSAYLAAIQTAQEEGGQECEDYTFDQFPGGGQIEVGFRRLFLRELVRAEEKGYLALPSPFGPQGGAPFFEWLLELIAPTGGEMPVPRLVLLLWETRSDLVAAFPEPCGRDAVRLVEWFRTEGKAQYLLPPALVREPIPLDEGGLPRKLIPGLEIVGYLHTESGVGQAARLLTRAVEGSTIPFATRVDSTAPSRQDHPFSRSARAALSAEQAYDRCVLCVNADLVGSARRLLGKRYFQGRRVAGLWFWEVEKLPKNLHASFREVDEVWVASEFIRGILAPISPVPVYWIPLPFGVAQSAPPLDRAALGLPDGFFFLFSFDFHSIFQRKNPVAVIAAFKIAFQEGEGPCLVIKTINGHAHLEALEQLRFAARDRADIVLLTEYLAADTNLSLTAACDCYVSLHRSEGLGLTMAEAMSHGRPVIATGYSGNMDFMHEGNSFLCRFTMTPVGEGNGPYCASARWAEPEIAHAAELMRTVYDDPGKAAARGKLAAQELADRYNPERCTRAVEDRWHAMQPVIKPSMDDHPDLNSAPAPLSKPVETLRHLWKRPFDQSGDVPSLGTFLFQGPKILRKLLHRMARHRKPFDKALVETASNHDKRLAALERSLWPAGATNGAAGQHSNVRPLPPLVKADRSELRDFRHEN